MSCLCADIDKVHLVDMACWTVMYLQTRQAMDLYGVLWRWLITGHISQYVS